MCQADKCCRKCNKQNTIANFYKSNNEFLRQSYHPNKLGGLFDNILNATNTALNFLNSSGVLQPSGQAGSGQAKGLAAIQTATSQILASIDQIVAAFPSLNPTQQADAYHEAERIEALLSNNSVIYQAKNGQDAAVLNNAKAQAKAKLASMVAITNQQNAAAQNGSINTNTSNNNTSVVNSNGQSVYVPLPTTSLFGNLDDQSKQLLTYGGIAVIAYLLIKK